MIHKGANYYYSCLSEDNKKIYHQIYEALVHFKSLVFIKGAFHVDIQKIVYAILFDHPEFFYLNRKRIMITKSVLGVNLMFHYEYSKKEAYELWQKIQSKIDELMTSIRSDMKPLACQIAVHRWMQQHIKIATKPYDQTCFTIVGALVKGECVCEGFAHAYKLICDRLHIASIIVNGIGHLSDGTTQRHAWNITKINGVTSHIDVTWDTILGVGSYDYFNLNDDEIAVDHDFDKGMYPICTSKSLSYFTLNEMIAYHENDLKRIVTTHYDDEYFSIQLAFPWKPSYVTKCGFPKGKIRINQARNIIAFYKC